MPAERSQIRRRTCRIPCTVILLATLTHLLTGCGRDARLADQKLRDPKVKAVTAYGKTLDASASPRDVVYVLLEAIVDDYAAHDDRDKREAALQTQFDVCAPDKIKQELRADLLSPREQLENLYEVVHHWAPTLGFYRASFAGEFPDVAQRMHVEYPLQAVDKTEQATVYLNLDHPDPPSAGLNSGVVAKVRLVREQGYWRVWWVGFDSRMRDWRTRFPPERPAPATPTPAPK